MNYPIIFKLHYSKKYLQFFYAVGFLTIFVIWYYSVNLYISIFFSAVVGIYSYIYHTKIILQVNDITINKENIVINNQKVYKFEVLWTNNLWSGIRYKYKNGKFIKLLIFNDSCANHSIFTINKYFNFGIKV